MTSTFIRNTEIIRSGEKITGRFTLRADDQVTVTVVTSGVCFPLLNKTGETSLPSSPDGQIWQVTKTCAQLYQPGENVLFRLVEKLGKGKVIIHLIGLVRIKSNWSLEQADLEIQFYSFGESGLFTASLIHQKDTLEQLKQMVKGDNEIPPYENYVEFVPEVNTFLWVNIFDHTAAIVTEDGSLAFAHRNDIKVGHSSCFKAGAKVTFELVPSQGSFPWKAVNIGWAPQESL